MAAALSTVARRVPITQESYVVSESEQLPYGLVRMKSGAPEKIRSAAFGHGYGMRVNSNRFGEPEPALLMWFSVLLLVSALATWAGVAVV